MQSFSSTNLKKEVILFIRNWVRLLSENNKAEAFGLLDKSAYLIKENIEYSTLIDLCFSMYYEDTPYPIFTNPDEMDLSRERISFYDYNDGSGFAVDYDLPLNKEWSDFTAQFEFKKIDDSLYSVSLEDIHVL